MPIGGSEIRHGAAGKSTRQLAMLFVDRRADTASWACSGTGSLAPRAVGLMVAPTTRGMTLMAMADPLPPTELFGSVLQYEIRGLYVWSEVDQ